MDFVVPADDKVNLKEINKRDKYLDLARGLKKLEHESDGDTNCNWHARYTHQTIGTGTGGLGHRRTSEDHINNSIVRIDQNTEKSPGDLRRLAVTQTPMEKHQLTPV